MGDLRPRGGVRRDRHLFRCLATLLTSGFWLGPRRSHLCSTWEWTRSKPIWDGLSIPWRSVTNRWGHEVLESD
jgi:hypothetical protein